MTQKIITVQNISKKFKIPHTKITSLRDEIFSLFSTKTYEEFHALDDISLEINKGEFIGIVGKNGSGKSTLLKILAGIYSPDSGKISINGSISPFLELGVGFNGDLTARENIFLNGTILGIEETELKNKFDDIISFAELEKFVDTKVKTFSSGMYARLAFSVAIHADADIYLMDEVLAVGDISFQKRCIETLHSYKNKGKTIILVSHDLSQIKQHASRAILFENGKIVADDSPERVLSTYVQHSQIFESEHQLLITNVAIHKKDSSDELSTGDDISISWSLEGAIPHEIDFIIAIQDDNGAVLFATNTIHDTVTADPSLTTYTFDLKKVPLRGGIYFAEISVIDKQFRKVASIPYAGPFSISPPRKTRGSVDILYNWNVT